MHGGQALRTLIVDSDPLVRLDLSEAFKGDGSFAVSAELASPPTGEELFAYDGIDLALLSGPLVEPESVDAVSYMVEAGKQVVVYGGQACDTSLVSALLLAGCSGYLSTQTSTTDVPRAVTNLLAAQYRPARPRSVRQAAAAAFAASFSNN
jgi:DNA-binding NarL/FixJ family response regulator